MTSIFYSRLSEANHTLLLQTRLPNYSTEFQRKVLSFRRWQDAQLSLLGRDLLFKGIKELSGAEAEEAWIKYTPFSKPYFEEGPVRFNISHSGEIVVCAINMQEDIGVDIEEIKDIDIHDFKSQMTDNEWKEIIHACDQKEAFFNYWTRKESVIKAHGEGLSIPLHSFEIIDNRTLLNEELFYVTEISIDEHYKCFVSTKGRGEVKVTERCFPERMN